MNEGTHWPRYLDFTTFVNDIKVIQMADGAARLREPG